MKTPSAGNYHLFELSASDTFQQYFYWAKLLFYTLSLIQDLTIPSVQHNIRLSMHFCQGIFPDG